MLKNELDAQGEALCESILAAMIAHEYYSPQHATRYLIDPQHLRDLRCEAHTVALTDYKARTAGEI